MLGLKVVQIDVANNLVVVRGSVPGSDNAVSPELWNTRCTISLWCACPSMYWMEPESRIPNQVIRVRDAIRMHQHKHNETLDLPVPTVTAEQLASMPKVQWVDGDSFKNPFTPNP